jgi:type III secretion system inner membrane ring protein
LLLGGWVLVRLVPAVGNRLRTAWQRVSARGTGTGTGATGWRRWRGA